MGQLKMKEYKIIHREEWIGHFYVDAESKEDALKTYHQMVSDGRIDFGDVELVDGEDSVEEIE